MRDPARILPIIDALRARWEQVPDLRIGQIIHNLTPTGRDQFYVEDDEWLELLKAATAKGKT